MQASSSLGDDGTFVVSRSLIDDREGAREEPRPWSLSVSGRWGTSLGAVGDGAVEAVQQTQEIDAILEKLGIR